MRAMTFKAMTLSYKRTRIWMLMRKREAWDRTTMMSR
jgi:hypothetical protein